MNKINGNNTMNGKGVAPKLVYKQKITEEYILQSAVNSLSNAKLAVSLSNKEILYFDSINKLKASSLQGHEKTITGIKFSKENHLLYSSSLDGTICVWDIRSGMHPVNTFSDKSDGALKPLLCFDLNAEEKFLCAGTELIREDAFLIFWDLRNSQSVGGYWNSHTDDITQVQFHSSSNSSLASSSVDGLINIFDLTETTEEDALINTLNAETSINRFCWNGEDAVSCITGTEECQFWSTEQTSPSLTVSRKDLEKNPKYLVDYLIDTFCVGDSFYLAAGSNDGCMQLNIQKENSFKQVALFEERHTDVIRTVSYCQNGNLITGGEDGHICSWKVSL